MNELVKTLFSANLYKSSQGRVARRCTLIGLALVFVLGAYCLMTKQSLGATVSTPMAAIIAVLGMWISFRVVNYPAFADFLVSVEAEMVKVSWPNQRELMTNTVVCLFFMFLLTALIFVYDIIFRSIFSIIQ